MHTGGYESGLYYNCKLCKQDINKRANDVTVELINMKLCPQCYTKELTKLIHKTMGGKQ